MHRKMVVLAGDQEWQLQILTQVLAGQGDDVLWVANKEVTGFPYVDTHKVQSWLGKEKKFVIFDANSNFFPDSFAAISGIVIGGGVLFLLLPEKNKWDKLYDTVFGQRLIKKIRNSNFISVIEETTDEININVAVNNTSKEFCTAPFLSADQQHVVETIEKQVAGKNKSPIVLLADRGRGKSAALGIAAARLIKAGLKNITVTAPRLRSAEVVFKHAADYLPESVYERNKVTAGNTSIIFYSPDQLIREQVTSDILLVDEAAAIPVPLLSLFLDRYPQCVFSTTVHGYEGTGRGFALRFNKILDEKKPGWLKYYLKTPIRWAENDPLEKWTFELLCLDAEIVEYSKTEKIETSDINFRQINQAALANDETLLKQVFALLVLAHYRTQPSDLVRLLEDENLTLYVGICQDDIVAVALVSHEGEFSAQLSTQVYRGERRPPGHLLAQALTYHCGVESAAVLKYARVMRIAVHPGCQNHGIGSDLLAHIIKAEKQAGNDAIGSSFGLTPSLFNFWYKAGFRAVRIGFKREQTSGEHAAVILLPLTSEGEKVFVEAEHRFLKQLPCWYNDSLRDISDEIKNQFLPGAIKTSGLDAGDRKDLESYINYSRLYELCIYPVNEYIRQQDLLVESPEFPAKFSQVLKLKTIDNKSWKDISVICDLTGKAAAQKLFHRAVSYLFDLIENNKK